MLQKLIKSKNQRKAGPFIALNYITYKLNRRGNPLNVFKEISVKALLSMSLGFYVNEDKIIVMHSAQNNISR